MESAAIRGFRLSPQQARLWRRLSEDAAAPYHAQTSIAVEGDLEGEAVRDALRAIVNRHEALRTTFRRLPGMKVPFQVVADEGEPEWRAADLSGLDAARRRAAVEELEAEEFRRPFDVERGPVVRALLVRAAADSHLLVITLPALCADGQTLTNLFHELGREMGGAAGEAAGVEASDGETADEPLQYPDFAEWQRELLESDDDEARAGMAHWRRECAAPPKALALPFETGRGARGWLQAARVTAELDARHAARLEEVAARHSVPVRSLLLAAWLTLLYRFTGEERVTAGFVPGERKYEDLSGACGLFTQPLPAHVSLSGELNFAEVARRSEEAARGCEDWQEYFSEQGQGDAPVAAETLPLFGFEYLDRPPAYSAAALTFTQQTRHAHLAPFKIKLAAGRAGDALLLELHYDRSLYAAADVALAARCFEELLKSVAGDASAAVSELNLLADEDRRRLLAGLDDSAADFPRQTCFHRLFEEQAALVPGRAAVVCGDRRLTYAELNARANRLARALRRKGVGPDTPVCLLMGRSVDLVTAVLAVLKAGGAYVPLNSDDPPARLRRQIEGVGARLLITHGGLGDSLGELACERVRPEDEELWRGAADANLEDSALPENLAYVIHTSGSTGAPKGVAVTHRGLVNYVHFIRRKLGLDAPGSADPPRFATVSTVSADLGNTAIFPSLAAGGCLHIISYETATDGEAFADYVSRHSIDVLKIVPSHLNALLAARQDGAEALLPAKWLILGGEAFPLSLAERLLALPGSRRVVNHYGPTETTVGSLTFDLGRAGQETGGVGALLPIGRPIANTRVHVLDERMALVPPGITGELYIGGEGLARGYLNAPALTAERFVPDPFAAEPGARLYRTGDLARRLPDGNITFAGRRDEQVKIRGYRIEPAEVAAALAAADGVREAFVTTREDAKGEGRLIAYVVSADEGAADANRLSAFLKSRLPEYMVPSAFVFVAALPLTANGKIDRRALPAPGEAKAAREYVGPRTESEEVLARLWREVLRVERVGVFDNFFDLGGDSIAAIQVVARANAAGLHFTVRKMFEHQTVAALAEQAAAAPAAAADSSSDDTLSQLGRESIEKIAGAVNFET